MDIKKLPQNVSTYGLIAYYKLFAGLTSTANVFDYSQNGNTGTPTGTDIAPSGDGFSFNGTDDWIDVGDISGNANTISMWFYSDTEISKSSTGVTPIHLGAADATKRIGFGAETGLLTDEIITVLDSATGRSGYTSASDTIAANTWHHLCCVWDGSKYLIYLNSEQKQNAVNATPSLIAADQVEIGRKRTADRYFGGKIGEVMIFNVSKTAAEVKSIYELTRWRYR